MRFFQNVAGNSSKLSILHIIVTVFAGL